MANPGEDNDDDDPVRRTALEAWRRLAEGHRSGDFGPYLAMLTEDYTFSMPVGRFRGEHVGRAEAAACYREIAASKPDLSFDPPLRVTRQEHTVVIEFEDHGTVGGHPYRNRIASSFDVRGERIRGYREYFGDVDPGVIARMAGQAPPGQS